MINGWMITGCGFRGEYSLRIVKEKSGVGSPESVVGKTGSPEVGEIESPKVGFIWFWVCRKYQWQSHSAKRNHRCC